MFYSIAFGIESSREEPDEKMKEELRSNIWLAFNDMRVIIETDIINMQALLILATQVTEFMTPSLCWNLVTNACVMLQALGVTHRHIDNPLREQRSIVFWRLNIFDKAMALTMARPPVFHHDTVSKIAMPTLEQLLPSNSTGRPSLFHAHFAHQIMLLSQVMGDIWQCVYGMEASDSEAIIAAKDKLESWNSNAVQILEATTIAEKPFLALDGIRAIDQGVETLRFHYRFLLILLCRCHKSLRGQCTEVSQDMLRSLENLMSNTNEQYGALIWQLLHYPFFVFMALFGEILVTGKTQLQTNQKSLECMEHLPAFLNQLRRRTPLAYKMESVATRVIEQARLWLDGQGDAAQPSGDQARSSTSTAPVEMTSPLKALLTPAATTDASSAYDLGSFDIDTDGLYSWDDDFLFNGAADWFKFDELV
ncbi:putative transcriptional regulatory protein C11D3.07c [Pseudocercospora fuligena]|uniref:Putative transcriptional regulatory protein C11D3.07c n=1 Tax=Pseudocercospora fuligena TaxID=685502 RepID=A0A8H6R6E0_9PEZI|nr:putative transcriptional regulatory protein C11D3.07c [Pseudocercospora fuligena]